MHIMYDENLFPFSHVQTLQHLKLKLSVAQQQQQQQQQRENSYLLNRTTFWIRNQNSFPGQRFLHNDYSIFPNINLYINIVQIINIGYWCYWKQYQKLVTNSLTNDWM